MDRRRISNSNDDNVNRFQRASHHSKRRAGRELCQWCIYQRDGVLARHLDLPDDRWRAGRYGIVRTETAFFGADDFAAATECFHWQPCVRVPSVRHRLYLGSGANGRHRNGGRKSEFGAYSGDQWFGTGVVPLLQQSGRQLGHL